MIKKLTVLLAIVLTARLGTVQFEGHRETYYNLNMQNICARAEERGIPGTYNIREDGCKCWGEYIICAANLSEHPYGSTVQTSLGTGIVLDTGEFAKTQRYTIDIATTW